MRSVDAGGANGVGSTAGGGVGPATSQAGESAGAGEGAGAGDGAGGGVGAGSTKRGGLTLCVPLAKTKVVHFVRHAEATHNEAFLTLGRKAYSLYVYAAIVMVATQGYVAVSPASCGFVEAHACTPCADVVCVLVFAEKLMWMRI